MANSSVFGSTGTEDVSALAGTDRLASDKQTFLKLLVAQLTHQDPLNPTEDKEFVTQLAQFTSLEQLQEINAGMGTLNTTMNQSQLMTATGFIGKDVVASGQQVSKLNDAAGNIVTTRVWFTVDQDVAKAQVNIYDGSGNPVFQENLGSHNAGTHTYAWSGTDVNGKEVPAGVYTIVISAQDSDDKAVIVKQQFTARVYGVLNENGVYKLVLDGGREVPIMDVTEISAMDQVTQTDNTTYADLAANQAAAASIAADQAAAYAAVAQDAATSKADAEKAAKSAASAAKSAKDAAVQAQKIADEARKNAESLKTAESLDIANKAKASASQAQVYADAAQAEAEAAEQAANAKP
ncbi:MAG: hypothetical protein LBV01_00025 [Deltaproteobacteria bacterium]|nr:hypothetical protein [Deltaproteobacteria bacterium]